MSKKINRENDTVEVMPESVKSEVALREEEILKFWQETDIFNKSVVSPAGQEPKGDYVFYDGPPFATGTPHYGHILAGTIKDAVPRFATMNGYRVERKWGWDCHGLPLENLIEKELGLATKRDIEKYGVRNFNEKARGAVLRYADDWKKIVPRMGRFVDMENDYRTMDSTYTESVWNVFKTLHEKGLVYEGFKSMHLCPRCGTTLSNFEVNQGYKDIKDIAVTVKMRLLNNEGEETGVSLLIWTTTPWTLPGNLAVAVHRDLMYTKVQLKETGEKLILAKERLVQLGDQVHEILEEMKGSDLVGLSYVPPFNYLEGEVKEGKDKAWKIYHADYVEVGEEGTGAVHIAPAYGEEDMNLAKAEGIPIVHHVDTEGRFLPWVLEFSSQLVKPKDDEASEISHLDADIAVVKSLQASQLLFKKENITHSYPHCWRCDTPLLNYATTSWFVKVTDLRDDLVTINSKINWVPDHVGANRFGRWLEGARDWAISRQRYWGAPLPIWRNPLTKEFKVFGSLEELKSHTKKSGNTYLVMRHGESENNVKQILNSDPSIIYPLTEKGREQVEEAIASLPKDIDLIITSPVSRAKETAEMIKVALGLSDEQCIVDERVSESKMADLEGKPYGIKDDLFAAPIEEFTKSVLGNETLNEIRQRVGAFLCDLENKYQGKKILIVSHGDPMWMLQVVAQGFKSEEALGFAEKHYLKNAEVHTVNFSPFPHNENYELDFHRPYIDEVEVWDGLVKLERVPDVFDCWFESGSMPYGQHHYPFEDKDEFLAKRFPAQFIAEGLDQTRGWFYSMLVLGVALFGRSPYENVIVNGLVLAEDGKKMSKSLRNYPDPMELVDRVGADALRFYLLSSPVIKGEDLNFSEKEVLELQRKNLGRLHNVLAMYEMYDSKVKASLESSNVLDRWILSRLSELISEVTTGFTTYELDRATRPITDFIDDLSVWYLRRSRERLKGEDEEDKVATLATLRYVLRELAKVMAPSMPFYAEYLYLKVRAEDEPESVHLCAWPVAGAITQTLKEEMQLVRALVTEALEARTKANIKVRQPLATLTLPRSAQNLSVELLTLITDEINVKEVVVGDKESGVELDTNLTPELKAEGEVRELIRAIQERRKAEGLAPQDRITLTIATSALGQEGIKTHQTLLEKTVGASRVEFTSDLPEGTVVKNEGETFHFTITCN